MTSYEVNNDTGMKSVIFKDLGVGGGGLNSSGAQSLLGQSRRLNFVKFKLI